MVQLGFWHRFIDTSIPAGQSLIQIPTTRNISLSGFGYGSDDALLVCRLELLHLSGSVKWIMPSSWDDSITPQGVNEAWIPHRTFATYRVNMREMPLDPTQRCDVSHIQVRCYNQDTSPHSIEGHVRGVMYG